MRKPFFKMGEHAPEHVVFSVTTPSGVRFTQCAPCVAEGSASPIPRPVKIKKFVSKAPAIRITPLMSLWN